MVEQDIIDCITNEMSGEATFKPTEEQTYTMKKQLIEYCNKIEKCSECPIFEEHHGEKCIYDTTKNRLTHSYLIAFGNFDRLKNIKEEPKSNYEKMKEIQKHYGKDIQIDKCAEECGELIRALMRFRNTDKDDPTYEMKPDNLLEKLADIPITTSEVCLSLGEEEVISKKISDIIDYKLDRQLRRIRDEEER